MLFLRHAKGADGNRSNAAVGDGHAAGRGVGVQANRERAEQTALTVGNGDGLVRDGKAVDRRNGDSVNGDGCTTAVNNLQPFLAGGNEVVATTSGGSTMGMSTSVSTRRRPGKL